MDIITNRKIVIKAAQTIWAMNKYFVLACDQNIYRQFRTDLKPNQADLSAVYHQLQAIQIKYQTTMTSNLPQITNALYHIAGYFKNHLSASERRALNELIQTDTRDALKQLEKYTKSYQITYLNQSNIWPKDRKSPFNLINQPFTIFGLTYPAQTIYWYGEYLVLKQEELK